MGKRAIEIGCRCFALAVGVVVLVALALPPSSCLSAGISGCAATIVDKVLGLLDANDGDPTSQRVNRYGAVWTADSNRSDAITFFTWNLAAGSESTRIFPAGTTHIYLMRPKAGAQIGSATDYVSVGHAAGNRQLLLADAGDELTIPFLKAPPLGTTLFAQPSYGALKLRGYYTVAATPE